MQTLFSSPHLNATSSSLRQTTISGNADESYVLSLAALNEKYAAMSSGSTSTSANKSDTCPIHIYSKNTLQRMQTFPGHEVASTSMRSISVIAGLNGPILMSSGKDGSVRVWDERSGSHGIKMTNLGKSQPLLAFDVSPDGYSVAAGTELQGDDALVLFWDPRQPAAPLRSHSCTHSDDITVVQFAPGRPGMLLTASSDGLISLSNAEEPDEDEAVVTVGNWGCSISQAGWMQDGSQIWAASDMETFSTWSEELDLLQSHDIRAPCLHSGPRTWVTDYLITASSSNVTEPGRLGVFVGSNEGDIALLSNSDLSTSRGTGDWYIHNLWTAGHQGVVRSVLWDEQEQVLVTGGEDGLINVWPGLSPPMDYSGLGGRGVVHESDSMDVDSEPAEISSRKRFREMDVEWEGDDNGLTSKESKNGKRSKR
ncbi:WD40-repeat-containing domain protein [Rhodocollybia butyracea]|uniref:WD40-repeat-containing domain protein n=1 Tax=Rhodocollybia butyracea TaxID=206335 RepID=A0A9P5QC76_9AGAR|nr:WD40-repeat-containing domain protein [Rhodocollybia butyracea]